MRTGIAAVAVFCLSVSAALADDLANGDAAYRQGNYAAAVNWYIAAATQDNGWAEYNLGIMSYRGLGLPKSEAMAVQWLTKAAAHPDMTARAAASLASIGHPLAPTASSASPPTPKSASSVALIDENGTFSVPVMINEAITLNFVLDSGASDVEIPADVVLTLARAGTISPDDLGQSVDVYLADGSKSTMKTITIRSLKVGNAELHNIEADISSANGTLLLGQSFLRQFKSWSVDNTAKTLNLADN